MPAAAAILKIHIVFIMSLVFLVGYRGDCFGNVLVVSIINAVIQPILIGVHQPFFYKAFQVILCKAILKPVGRTIGYVIT